MRPSPLPHTLYAISQQFYSNASSSTDFSVSADLCNALISSSDSEMGTFDINPSAPTILGIDRTTSLIPYSPSIIVEIGSIEVFMRLLLENMETVRLPLGQVPTCQVFHSMISAR